MGLSCMSLHLTQDNLCKLLCLLESTNSIADILRINLLSSAIVKKMNFPGRDVLATSISSPWRSTSCLPVKPVTSVISVSMFPVMQSESCPVVCFSLCLARWLPPQLFL